MVTVARLGRALFGESAGLTAGIVYGTMLLPMGVSEVAVHDIGLVPFLCIAALSIARIAGGPDLPDSSPAASAVSSSVPVASAFRRKIVLYAIIAGVGLGLSILTKGLVGMVFTGIFAACLVARRPASLVRADDGADDCRRRRDRGRRALVPRNGARASRYLHYYFIERHLQGYLTATQRHGGRPFWYYAPIIIGGALPWTAYLFPAGGAARGNSLRMALWGWFAIGLVFLSIGESKLVTYALPLFPALALIIGRGTSRASAP